MTFQLDCSHYNGMINWPAVKADGCVGAVVKTSQGATGVDPTWRANHDGARAVGIPVAPYHFSNDTSPDSEAAHFATFWSAGWDYRWWLDEELASASVAFITAFRARMRALTGYQLAGVYSSESLFSGTLRPSTYRDAHTGLWAARYGGSLGWDDPDLLIWQYSSTANVAGVVGHVDESEFMNGWTPARDGGTDTPMVITEDDMGYHQYVTGDGTTEQSVQVPAMGMRFARFHTGQGNQLTIKEALCAADTPAGSGVQMLAPIHPAGTDWAIDNDRPGPVTLPTGCSTLNVRFVCNGNATISTSAQ